MDDGARGTGSSGPVRERSRGGRARWGRRPPHGQGRHHNDGAGDRDAADRGGATYAALDLGTNNCRLLIARPSGDSFRVIDAFSRIIRLGEGVSTSGRISDAAI